MKKIILFFAFVLITLTSNAQFKISDHLFSNGFNTDTAVSISIKVISLNVLLESKEQRPIFYLSFNSKAGKTIIDRNIDYSDMQAACTKNGISLTQQEVIIPQTFTAVISGTKTQKLAAIRGLLDFYGIIVKPDVEQ